jgi:hypothetical protein
MRLWQLFGMGVAEAYGQRHEDKSIEIDIDAAC